jgi:hypothetical protein
MSDKVLELHLAEPTRPGRDKAAVDLSADSGFTRARSPQSPFFERDPTSPLKQTGYVIPI